MGSDKQWKHVSRRVVSNGFAAGCEARLAAPFIVLITLGFALGAAFGPLRFKG